MQIFILFYELSIAENIIKMSFLIAVLPIIKSDRVWNREILSGDRFHTEKNVIIIFLL